MHDKLSGRYRPRREGTLKKKARKGKAAAMQQWQTRFFRLKNNTLSYYKG